MSDVDLVPLLETSQKKEGNEVGRVLQQSQFLLYITIFILNVVIVYVFDKTKYDYHAIVISSFLLFGIAYFSKKSISKMFLLYSLALIVYTLILFNLYKYFHIIFIDWSELWTLECEVFVAIFVTLFMFIKKKVKCDNRPDLWVAMLNKTYNLKINNL